MGECGDRVPKRLGIAAPGPFEASRLLYFVPMLCFCGTMSNSMSSNMRIKKCRDVSVTTEATQEPESQMKRPIVGYKMLEGWGTSSAGGCSEWRPPVGRASLRCGADVTAEAEAQARGLPERTLVLELTMFVQEGLQAQAPAWPWEAPVMYLPAGRAKLFAYLRPTGDDLRVLGDSALTVDEKGSGLQVLFLERKIVGKLTRFLPAALASAF
ncbi:unnamed protein product [Prorocentrum cordatum]|uniref:Uncharacterized protein n=1 Tax=Prorocentrum cordatum TaxID=2364126 RepID=A0ABN9TUS8_9DINO|nr:unnamed protein product [Polarella glacialis]